MVLEIFEMKTGKSDEKLIVVSMRSLLADLRAMDIATDRDEKVILAGLHRSLMVGLGEIVLEEEKETPPEPPKAVEQPQVVEAEVVGEVPKPTKPEHKAQPKTMELAEDEFPLR